MKINATLTRCRHGAPLVVLNDRPFNGLEIRPAELLLLAQQLTELAAMADKQPQGKHFRPTKVLLDKEFA